MDRSAQWEAALDDALHGMGGGLVVGVPLLYAMEVWWLGQTAERPHALAGLALTFVPVFLLVATSGGHDEEGTRGTLWDLGLPPLEPASSA